MTEVSRDSPNFKVNILLELSRWTRWLEMCMVSEQQKEILKWILRAGGDHNQ